jgi:hypothetical protein
LGTTQQHQNLHFSKTQKKNKNKKKGASTAPAASLTDHVHLAVLFGFIDESLNYFC